MRVLPIVFAPINGSVVVGEPTQFQIIFSESVTGLELKDFRARGIEFNNLRSTDGGTTWLLDITAMNDSPVPLFDLKANSYQGAVSGLLGDGKRVPLIIAEPTIELNTTITIDNITADDVINIAESQTDVSVTGKVTGDYQAGDTVTITVNGTEYPTTVDAEGNYSVPVAGSDLVAVGTLVAVVTATDGQGNTGTAEARQNYSKDLEAPSEPVITFESTGADDVYNSEEVDDFGTVTATVTVPAGTAIGDTLTVNGTTYPVTQDVLDNGQEIFVEPGKEVTAIITDPAGNPSTIVTSTAPEADVIAPNAPIVTITEDKNGDGVIDYSEIDGDVEYTVAIGDDVEVGDTLVVNGTEIPVTEEIKQAGSYTGTLPAVDGEVVEVNAEFIDQAGNSSEVTTEKATLDLTIPDADPIYLWHLGANLSNIEGPSDARGKFGGKYGNDINYETGNLNDAIYIGYTGRDENGELVVSPWDGDFERDSEDGDAVWTMDTYAGNDLVYIREDQNAYTVAKLGSGDDTYYVQGEMDAVLGYAQTDTDARSFIYTESGNDNVVVGGNGEGQVTGWGIDGGRIFTGSGSDNVTVYGEMDDGGVIDLGAAQTDYAGYNDADAANTVDAAGDVNNVSISKNLGNAGLYDFGHIFGGTGDDNVTVGTFVEGASEINLGEGTNSVTIGDDLDGQAQVVTGSGNDTLVIGDDTEDHSSVNLGDGNNSIDIQSQVEDHSTITTGNGDDSLSIGHHLTNYAAVNLGDGNNIIRVGNSILGNTALSTGNGNDSLEVGYVTSGNSIINLGDGVNSITIGDDVDGNSRITTGSGDDTLTIGDDTEDTSTINLGDGNNAINVADALEDRSSIVTGEGNDTLTVGGSTWNQASVDLGAGDDTVTIAGSMHNSSVVNLGAGNDSMTVNGMHHYSQIDAGDGDDIITFTGEKMDGSINGGAGNDTLILDFTANDSLVSNYAHETNVSTKDISGFETVELNGKNVLDVRFEDLVQDSDRDGALFIQGTSDSKVDLGSTNWSSDGAEKAQWRDATTDGNWAKAGSETVDGVNYDVYHNSAATDSINNVYIEQGIVVI